MCIFNGWTLSAARILSPLFCCLQMALFCALLLPGVFSAYCLYTPGLRRFSFSSRDPAVLLLFVIPSLRFRLVLHCVKPLCQLFFHGSWCFSLSTLGADLSWSRRSGKVLLFNRSLQTSKLSGSFALHLSSAVSEDPPSELFSVLSISFLELGSALRGTAAKATGTAPQFLHFGLLFVFSRLWITATRHFPPVPPSPLCTHIPPSNNKRLKIPQVSSPIGSLFLPPTA